MNPPPTLSELQALHASVVQAQVRATTGQRPSLELAEALLARDLIPRHADDGTLIVGLVGPNNAGKSAVFNGLCGRVVSPSRATGGATRRIVAAARHPQTVRLRGELRAVEVHPSGLGIEAALDRGPANEWLVAQVPTLPEKLLLADSPDFDSIREGHHRAAESLLLVTDLAIAVVTKHCYQNQEVVEFLRKWLGYGRPYALVYNEATSKEVARAHVSVLEEAVGAKALARFWAPLEVAIAEGTKLLEPCELATGGSGLRLWLEQQIDPTRLLELAQRASLRSLQNALQEFVVLWQRREILREALLAVAQQEAQTMAQAVTQSAMPMGPVLQAFRNVLDRRPNLLRSTYRKGLRKASALLTTLYSKVSGRLPSSGRGAPETLKQAELEAFRPLWPPFAERLHGRLMAGGAAADVDFAAEIAADLDPRRWSEALAYVETHLQSDPSVWNEFTTYCEELVEAELEQRGGEWALQAMLDLAHILPAAVAGVIVVKSGGLLTDMAVGSMGALSSMAAERLSKFLGTQVAARARERWMRLRSDAWIQWIVDAALPSTWPNLRTQRDPAVQAIVLWLPSEASAL